MLSWPCAATSSILGPYGPVLLHLLGTTGNIAPAARPILRINSSNIALPVRTYWKYNFYKLRKAVLWHIVQALRKSLGLRPRDFPHGQAIFHRISLLLSLYRYSINCSVLSGQC